MNDKNGGVILPQCVLRTWLVLKRGGGTYLVSELYRLQLRPMGNFHPGCYCITHGRDKLGR